MQPVYVARDPHDKALQRALLQWRKPELRRLVVEALHKAHREDLIGYDRHCLIRPLHGERPPQSQMRSAGKSRGKSERKSGENTRRSGRAEGERHQPGAARTSRAPDSAPLRPSQKRSGKNNGGKKRRG